MPNTPHSQGEAIAQSNTANTRIVCGEIQDSKEVSESTPSVIASVAKQSTETDSKTMDCHADKSARNDSKTESRPLQNLESSADSEPTSAVGHSSTAIESSFSSKRCAEQALKASSGASGISASDCKGEGATSRAVAQPQTHTCTFKPLPLNKKEKKESDEVNEILEVKAKDSEKLESTTCHSEAIAEESISHASKDISNYRPQYDKVLESTRQPRI